MATTSMWAVKGWLGKVVIYVENPDKTKNPKFFEKKDMSDSDTQGLADVIEYASKDEKTAMKHFVSGVNCLPETARMEMMEVKSKFSKKGGRVAFHGYQSFAPGEVTPELTHTIGVELAEKLWGDRFQVIVATHLDKDNHLHNHFVLNSVSFADGKHYENNKADYRNMRAISDNLCREYGLSVIENPKRGKAKHRAEWQDEKDGKQTWRSIVKVDVDKAILESMTDREFFGKLRVQGYEIKQGSDISVRPPGKERFVRLNRNFGDDYSIENIRKRILENEVPVKPIYKNQKKKLPRISSRTISIKKPKKKISGLYGLYLRYQYLLGYLPRGSPKRNAKMHFLLKEDIAKLDKIIDETRLLAENHIENAEQLFSYRETVNSDVDRYMAARDELRKMLRRKSSVGSETKTKSDITAITMQLRKLRMELRKIDRIAERSGAIKEKMNTLQSQEMLMEKEVRENGQFR